MYDADIQPQDFRDNSRVAQWWRRYGWWLWLGAVPLAVALAPGRIGLLPWLEDALRAVPLLRSMLDEASSPGKVAAFAIATLAAYPLLQKTMSASRLAKPRSAPPLLMLLLVTLVLDAVLLLTLNGDIEPLDTGVRGRRRMLRLAMHPDSHLFPLGAAAQACVFQMTLFLHALLLTLAFSPDSVRRRHH
ncbi:hypothetical protein MMG85_15935 [Pseudoxanthomonas sp. LH2527]|uniref:hypothetical protein n=1 Tax=Pseudoxanthomonas sp. LH2527 TaxID=2923249 RepID=UPI001F130AEC|nr:hypothetical protein [Pseudoxanthomonas sp. LH2527]MCH6485042.1 hypothetical protein [Pseudoxanthomonas sp. LH2527]